MSIPRNNCASRSPDSALVKISEQKETIEAFSASETFWPLLVLWRRVEISKIASFVFSIQTNKEKRQKVLNTSATRRHELKLHESGVLEKCRFSDFLQGKLFVRTNKAGARRKKAEVRRQDSN